MGEKDITEKTLATYNDVFADIVNVLLFHGERLVEEDFLEDATPTSQYKLDENVHEQERDVVKYWIRDGRVRIALFGLENQTEVDPDMPIRCISYDGAAYRNQLNDEKQAKEGRKARYPVVTLVLYFGTKRWNKPKSLHELLDIPKALKPFVSDYRINVFEIAWLEPEQVELFQSDFKIVADYFVQMRRNKNYQPSSDTMRHVTEILRLLSLLTQDVRFEDIINAKRERSAKTMCEMIDRFIEQGRNEGIAQGRSEGIAQGRSEGIAQGRSEGRTEGKLSMLYELTKDGVLTLAEAAKRAGMSEKAFLAGMP